MFTYAATVSKVTDADSLHLDVDLGFHAWLRNQSFPILGINGIELRDPGGKEARDNLAVMLPVGSKVTLRSVKPDKYGGRFLAVITLADGTDLATRLTTTGWASAWDGKGPRPVPAWPRETDGAPNQTAG